MKKSRILAITTLMFALMIALMTTVYAYSVTLSLVPSAREVKEGGEFTVVFKAENIDAGQGINKIEGTLNFDDKLLNPVSEPNIESVNGWKTTYDSFNKKITATNAQPVKVNGNIFQISFKAKSTKQDSATPVVNALQPTVPAGVPTTGQTEAAKAINIEFKNIKGSNGLENFPINDVSTTVNVGNVTTPVTPAVTTPQVTQTTPVTTPVVKEESTVAPVNNPKAGVEDTALVLMIALAMVATTSFISLARLNKKHA